MSRSNGRVMLTALLCMWFYLPCSGQVFPKDASALPHSGDETLVSKTHDLSSAIAAHVRSSKLPDSQAKERALISLFLTQNQVPPKRKEIRSGVFEVVATEAFHDHLTGVAKWMADGEKQITIESRIVTVSEEALRKLHTQFGAEWEMTAEPESRELDSPVVLAGPDFGSFPQGPVPIRALASSTSNTKQLLPCRIASIRERELNRIVAVVQADTRTNIMQAPKVTMFPGQEVVVSDSTHRPFVTSVKPSDDTADAVMEPVISVLEDGLTMRIKASVVGENEVQMNSDVILGEIGNVDEFTFETPGRFNGTTVQIPEYTERKVSVSKKLGSDQSLIIDPHFFTEKVTKRRFRRDVTTREYTIVILTARVIDPESESDVPKVAKL